VSELGAFSSTPATAKPTIVIVLPMLDAALPSPYAPKA
jgi:hypothetical protein